MTAPLTRPASPPTPARPRSPLATLGLRLGILAATLVAGAWLTFPLVAQHLPGGQADEPAPGGFTPALPSPLALRDDAAPAPAFSASTVPALPAPADGIPAHPAPPAADQAASPATPPDGAGAAAAAGEANEASGAPDAAPLAAYGYGIKTASVAAPHHDPRLERRQRLAALSQTPAFQTLVGLIGRRVGQHWNAPADYRAHGAEVRVQVGPGGRLLGVEILQSSDNAAYNKSVLAAALAASPFTEVNALPEDAQAVFSEFTLTFGSPPPLAAPTAARSDADSAAAEGHL